MSRPLRLELAGGLYHVTSRGDGQEDIYLSDADRLAWLDVLGQEQNNGSRTMGSARTMGSGLEQWGHRTMGSGLAKPHFPSNLNSEQWGQVLQNHISRLI